MMINVAGLAMGLGVLVEIGRLQAVSNARAAKAEEHQSLRGLFANEAHQNAIWRQYWSLTAKKAESDGSDSELRRCRENEQQCSQDGARAVIIADYHSALSIKYKDAARRPWSSVAPDPPGPE